MLLLAAELLPCIWKSHWCPGPAIPKCLKSQRDAWAPSALVQSPWGQQFSAATWRTAMTRRYHGVLNKKEKKRDKWACGIPWDAAPGADGCLDPFCYSQPGEGNPSVCWHPTGMTSPFFLRRSTAGLVSAIKVCVTGKALLFCHLLLAHGPEKISTALRSS